MKHTYEINHVETSTPSYFSGSHNPVIQVPVTNKSTYQEVKESLLSYEATEHLEDDLYEKESYQEHVNKLFQGLDLNAIPKCCTYIEDLTDESDFDEGVYMYFTIQSETLDRLNELKELSIDLQGRIDSFEPEQADFVDEFDELLDEEGYVTILNMTYSKSYVLKNVDPIAYRCSLADYVASVEIENLPDYIKLVEEMEELTTEIDELINNED
jgi:hypothetical protein